MEIQGEDGSMIIVETGTKREFGRGLGFQNTDRTVSRRHVSFELCSSDAEGQDQDDPGGEPRVSFEVLGKNPIWVCSGSKKDIRVFKKSDKGQMGIGDYFFVSGTNPILFEVKKCGFVGEENEERVLEEGDRMDRMLVDNETAETGRSDDDELGFRSLDASEIDPVKEFGFVVMGREFDNYPKQMIRDIKDLDWFIEEPKEYSEDDEVTFRNRTKRKKGVKGKKNDIDNDDEDWTGESEDEKVLTKKLRKDRSPRGPRTSSKDTKEPVKDTCSSKTSVQKKVSPASEDSSDDDDTLGGFIVDEEELEEECDEDDDAEEEEQEDFEEDEDDDCTGEEETP